MLNSVLRKVAALEGELSAAVREYFCTLKMLASCLGFLSNPVIHFLGV